MGSPDCKDLKNAMEEVNFWGTRFTETKPQKRCESGFHARVQIYFFSKKFFSGFSSFGQLTLDMGVFRRFIGSPDCKDLKNAMGEVNFWGTWFTHLLGGFGGVDDL